MVATSLLYMAVWGMAGWGTVPPAQHRPEDQPVLGGGVVQAAGPGRPGLLAGGCDALALLLVPVSVAAGRRTATRAAS
jgi:hypothetical protein